MEQTASANYSDPWESYRQACELMIRGERGAAHQQLLTIREQADDTKLQALISNDLAVLAAHEGNLEAARLGFRAALAADPCCTSAAANLAEIETSRSESAVVDKPSPVDVASTSAISRIKVAILSFLFNWPSTGGGIVHTVELAKFLEEAGYEVKHFHVQFLPWGIGEVTAPTPFISEVLAFEPRDWHVAAIQQRYRAAVDLFQPDYVILTDSWNFKPLLAEAVRGYPYFLRLQALECLCPLNNVRLIPEPGGRFRQCPLHQLATPVECGRCIRSRGHLSGSLHQAERALCGVGTSEYQEKLLRAFAEAEAVLVVNPLAEAMVSAFAKQVKVVTAGMDPVRFPWPSPRENALRTPGKMCILFAGIPEEWMKGFHVLREAGAMLWQRRQDFEVIVTGNEAGRADPFIRYIGWQSQEQLPRYLRACDILVMPTIAQEALGRTAVEAMASGRPVVASRIGGLPFTVLDGATGLLCEPGDARDLTRKLETLLDSPALRERLGQAGRTRFEENYTWPVIIARHYRPLLKPSVNRPSRPVSNGSTQDPSRAQSNCDSRLAAIGCVLAIRDRPPELLERTLQTYCWQTHRPVERVLLDYGSDSGHAAAYRELCGRYEWRLIRFDPPEPRWHLAAAYNRAITALGNDVEVVFKNDADVLLGPDVLATAARLGRNSFALFPFLSMPRDISCPAAFTNPIELQNAAKQFEAAGPSLGMACSLARSPGSAKSVDSILPIVAGATRIPIFASGRSGRCP